MSTIWILRLTCLLQIASMGILFVFEAVRMKDMGVNESEIGLILGFSSGIFIFFSIFWGRLADKKGWHKKIVVWGTFGFAGLLFYFAFCTTPWQFFVYGIMRSVFMPMIAGIMPTIAVKAHGEKQQGRKFGIYRAFGSIGFILGTMVLPLILNDIAIVAQTSSLFLIGSLFLISKLPKPEAIHIERAPLKIRNLDSLIKLFLFSMFFISLADPAVHGFFNAYARDLGGSTRLLGLLAGMFGLVAFFFLPLMGRAIDHFRPSSVLVISLLFQPLRVFVTSTLDDPNFLWIPILFHGICWGGMEVAAVVYLSRRVREGQKATVLSYYMAVRMLGTLVGASICGYVAEHFGYVLMFRTISAAALVGALIYVFGIVLSRIRERSTQGSKECEGSPKSDQTKGE